MTREQIWTERVREWRASGKSMSDFSRGQAFTASGLAYWIKRLDTKPKAVPVTEAPVRLARVVRASKVAPSTATATATEGIAVPCRTRRESGAVVVEVLAVRAVVPADLVGTQLESVVASLTRGWTGAGA